MARKQPQEYGYYVEYASTSLARSKARDAGWRNGPTEHIWDFVSEDETLVWVGPFHSIGRAIAEAKRLQAYNDVFDNFLQIFLREHPGDDVADWIEKANVNRDDVFFV